MSTWQQSQDTGCRICHHLLDFEIGISTATIDSERGKSSDAHFYPVSDIPLKFLDHLPPPLAKQLVEMGKSCQALAFVDFEPVVSWFREIITKVNTTVDAAPNSINARLCYSFDFLKMFIDDFQNGATNEEIVKKISFRLLHIPVGNFAVLPLFNSGHMAYLLVGHSYHDDDKYTLAHIDALPFEEGSVSMYRSGETEREVVLPYIQPIVEAMRTFKQEGVVAGLASSPALNSTCFVESPDMHAEIRKWKSGPPSHTKRANPTCVVSNLMIAMCYIVNDPTVTPIYVTMILKEALADAHKSEKNRELLPDGKLFEERFQSAVTSREQHLLRLSTTFEADLALVESLSDTLLDDNSVIGLDLGEFGRLRADTGAALESVLHKLREAGHSRVSVLDLFVVDGQVKVIVDGKVGFHLDIIGNATE